MAVLELLVVPDPRLKICSEPVEAVTPELQNFMDDMLETMYATHGVGLAAVQVGVHKRILVMDVDQKEGEHGNPIFMVNPQIMSSSVDTGTYEEGCLSVPGVYADVDRPKTVVVTYLDYHGKKQELYCEGLLATCVQHEIDHLNGKVFVDHLSALKRQMLVKKSIKIHKAEK